MNAPTDMSQVIIAKSDQVNSDDLVSGARTIRISGVKISPGTEQPVSISIEDETKVWRPCKTASRLLVAGWGPDASQYTGRSATLYRDPTVKWGGLAVGGIRVSAMSDIDPKKVSDGKMTITLKESRNHSKTFVIKLIEGPPAAKPDPAGRWAEDYQARARGFSKTDEMEAFATSKSAKLEELRAARPDLAAQVDAALAQRRSELSAPAPTFTDEDPPASAAVEGSGEASDVQDGDAADAGRKGRATTAERMAKIAEPKPEHVDEQTGEITTLASAKAEIESAELVGDVNNRLAALREHLSDDESDELTLYAGDKIDRLKAAKK